MNKRSATALVTLVLLAGVSACGQLDEHDTYPPSVKALTRWDSSHVLAVRSYQRDAAILDSQTGQQTGRVKLGQLYEDIGVLEGGDLLGRTYHSIDHLASDGRLDPTRSIRGAFQYMGLALSGDRSTFAYSQVLDPPLTKDQTIGVVSLKDGVVRLSPPGTYFQSGDKLGDDGLVLSRDGNLLAILGAPPGVGAPAVVTLARTYVPAPALDPMAPEVPALSTCAAQTIPADPDFEPAALTFSPVGERLAVASYDGWVAILDVSSYPACPLLAALAPPAAGHLENLSIRYSPDGAVLAVVEDRPATADVPSGWWVRLMDANTGAFIREWLVVSGEGAYSDAEWSDAGDRLTVSLSRWSGSGGSVQQSDVATGLLLWTAKL